MGSLLDSVFTYQIALFVLVVVILKSSMKFVPQNRAFIIERFGKYNRTLEAGLNFIVPFIDTVSYDRSLKEQAIDVPSQGAITRDNISLTVDGVLYLKVLDPYKASYGVEDYTFAVTQLAQTTMRSEIGKMELDKTFEERDALNINIVNSINEAAQPWGVQVLRYEIKDIVPPQSVMEAMERQMKAEREKRAKILESEGDRQAAINVAEGQKQSIVLAAEADKEQQILKAEGEASAIIRVAEAKAEALAKVGEVANTSEGGKAIELDLATLAIAAKEAIAKQSSVVLLPDSATDISNVVSQATAVWKKLTKES
ncbi:slipin family protein [Bowmanella sp. JS7-9]|uniref:SPFH domain-containing protein n=1 Tax=Pseudobowmanella zhangzhouensis TaxID=1537679 RepID=A0ABW1XIT4_9ALTE|nr:slipin family protein [Bowmanella sp. JS7-9]TBX24505.1 stomatin 2 [Bowmanella sp. JS7-9]